MIANWINRPADDLGPAYSFATIDRGAPWDAGVRLRHTVEVSGEDHPLPATWAADVELTTPAEDGDISSVGGRAIVHLQGDAPTLAEAKAAALAAVAAVDTETVDYDYTPLIRSTYTERMAR